MLAADSAEEEAACPGARAALKRVVLSSAAPPALDVLPKSVPAKDTSAVEPRRAAPLTIEQPTATKAASATEAAATTHPAPPERATSVAAVTGNGANGTGDGGSAVGAVPAESRP